MRGKLYFSLLFFATGYSAFQTNLNINVKGNIKQKTYAIEEFKSKYCNTTSGDGLYVDTYESGRCVYKGSDPDNYITFNNELWRIMSIENDDTLKIIRNERLGLMLWDTSYSNQWNRPADLNTYLNEDYYMNVLSETAKSYIYENHSFYVGSITDDNSNLMEQIASEKSNVWKGNIALMSVSDVLKTNSNTEQCGNLNLNNYNHETCKTTNYIVPTLNHLWTITPSTYASHAAYPVYSDGIINGFGNVVSVGGVVPTIYLKTGLTLKGKGTSDLPYQVEDM